MTELNNVAHVTNSQTNYPLVPPRKHTRRHNCSLIYAKCIFAIEIQQYTARFWQFCKDETIKSKDILCPCLGTVAKFLSLTSLSLDLGKSCVPFQFSKTAPFYFSFAMILSLSQQNFQTCADIFQFCQLHLLNTIYFYCSLKK